MEEPRPSYDFLFTAYVFWQAKQEVQPAAGKGDVYAPALDVTHSLDQSRSLVSSIVTNYACRTVVCAGWLWLVLRCMTFAYWPDSSSWGIYTTPSGINLSHRRMYIWDPRWNALHTSERGKTCYPTGSLCRHAWYPHERPAQGGAFGRKAGRDPHSP